MPVALVTLQVRYLYIALLTIWNLQVPRPWDFSTRLKPAATITQSDDATSPSVPRDAAEVISDTSPNPLLEKSKSPEVLAAPHETSPLV